MKQTPWGSWLVLDIGDRHKVKRLHIDPGARLSYQSHRLRAERWFIVSGVATCVIEDDQLVVHEGGTVEVPEGAKHRVGNDGTDELVVIEVQYGDYTGEDDIVRWADDYGRR